MAAPRLFISYAHEDAPLALALADALERRGLRVWLDRGELRVGDSMIERVSHAIAEGDFLLAIVSHDSLKVALVSIRAFVGGNKGVDGKRVVVLPVRYRAAPMPDSLRDRYWADADRGDVPSLADRLVRDVHRHFGTELQPDAAGAAWLKETLVVFAAEPEPVRHRWLDHLARAEQGAPMRVRIGGSAYYSAAAKLVRVGALRLIRESRGYAILDITDRGRSLLKELRVRQRHA